MAVMINGSGSWGNCLMQGHLPLIHRFLPWYTNHYWSTKSYGFYDDGASLWTTSTPRSQTVFDSKSPQRTIGATYFTGLSYEERVQTMVRSLYPDFHLPAVPRVVGWNSWHTYFQYLTREKLRVQLTLANKVQRELVSDFRYFLIDHGYARIGDLQIDSQQWIWGMLSEVQDRGLVPGIWVAPFISVHDYNFPTEVPWYRSQFVKNYGPNSDQTHFMNVMPYQDQKAIDEMLILIRRLYEVGVRLFKFDFNLYFFWQAGDYETLLEKYRNFYKAVRSLAPEAILIGCGVPLLDSVGLFDFVRVTKDTRVHWAWSDRWTAYLQRVRNGDVQHARVVRQPFDGRLWHADYDMMNTPEEFWQNRNHLNLAGFDLNRFFERRD